MAGTVAQNCSSNAARKACAPDLVEPLDLPAVNRPVGERVALGGRQPNARCQADA
jgi:hypothetical protein